MTQNKKRKASVAVAVTIFGLSGLSGAVQAGPSGGQVVAGDATIAGVAAHVAGCDKIS